MKYGVWVEWAEAKPCYPGTDEHNPSAGRWYVAGAAWMTERSEPELFDCIVGAAEAGPRFLEARRHAHPPFTRASPRPYRPTSPGELEPCVMSMAEVLKRLGEAFRACRASFSS